MIATNASFEPHSSDQLPASTRVYLEGAIHPDVRVPVREIALQATKTFSGALETNEPVRVYDTSGPWGDPGFEGDPTQGLPPLRSQWILGRADVDSVEGREVQPMDNGYLSGKHAEYASKAERNRLLEFPGLKRAVLRAKPGKTVTQLQYARAGIITPEMEFIAIRENMGRQKIADRGLQIADFSNDILRNDLNKQHAGSAQLSSLEISHSSLDIGHFFVLWSPTFGAFG